MTRRYSNAEPTVHKIKCLTIPESSASPSPQPAAVTNTTIQYNGSAYSNQSVHRSRGMMKSARDVWISISSLRSQPRTWSTPTSDLMLRIMTREKPPIHILPIVHKIRRSTHCQARLVCSVQRPILTMIWSPRNVSIVEMISMMRIWGSV